MVAVLEVLLVMLVLGTTLSPAAHHMAHSSRQARQKRNLCQALDGKCLLGRRQSCDGKTLPSRLCGSQGGTCCISGLETFISNFVKPVKRLPLRGVCQETSRKCEKRGGSCIPTSSPCNTFAKQKFCSGNSCTCCFGDHEACSSTPACKGGFCFKGNGKKKCRGGKIIKSGCKGEKCSCCIPKGSQAGTGGDSGRCSCGRSNADRIIGGHEITPNKYPWLVGILIHHYHHYICGGTLISPYFVLTACHCLYDFSSRKLFDPINVKVGVADHNQASNSDDIKGVTRLVNVKEIIPHETFIIYRPYHDIGLLRLATKLDLKSHPQVQAVCLPFNSDHTYEGAIGVAAGWGVKVENSSQVEDVARDVNVPILGPSCKDTQFGNVIFTSNMLCAGVDEGGKDTCLGDSGGPFTVKINNRHVIVGLTAFGIGCGRPYSPGVYTRITTYLSWITSKVQDTCSYT